MSLIKGEKEVKDIKWANEEIKKERNLLNDTRYEKEVDDLTTGVLLGLKKALNILDQLDEPEVLSQEWIDRHTYYEDEYDFYYADPDELKNLLVPTVSEMKKVQLSQETADELNRYKELGYSLKDLLVIVASKQAQEKLARAWLDGYEVEEEQKYYVINNDQRMMLVRKMDGKTITEADPFKLEDMYEVEKKSHRLTEQEIKDYDERYWPFAVKVEELEE